MSTAQSILIIHIGSISETVLSIPALRSLRKHLPQARLTVAASRPGSEIIRLSESADEILTFTRLERELFLPQRLIGNVQQYRALRQRMFDTAVVLQSNLESSWLTRSIHANDFIGSTKQARRKVGALDKLKQMVLPPQMPLHLAQDYLKRLEPLGVRPLETEPRLQTSHSANERFEKFLKKRHIELGELMIGIHAGMGRGKERWPMERFASVASRMIHNFDARVLVFAGPHERGLARSIVKKVGGKKIIAMESQRLEDVVSAAARLSLLVANHSGLAHIASAVGAAVVTATGAMIPKTRDLLSRNHVHVRATSVSSVGEEEVFDAACRLLKRNRSSAFSSFSS